jgi:hypothetical protein
MAPKFSKNVEWLRPFWEAAADLLPEGKLAAVKGYHVPLTKDIKVLAACHSELGERKVTITICLDVNHIQGGRVVRRKPHCMEEFLMIFAHELAHVPQRFHAPYHPISHWELTIKILGRFTRVLKKQEVTNTVARISAAVGKKE